MEQMPLQAAGLQTNTMLKISSRQPETEKTSSFESLLAEKRGDSAPQTDTADESINPENNPALLEQAAAGFAENLAWGNLVLDMDSLQQGKITDLSGLLQTEQVESGPDILQNGIFPGKDVASAVPQTDGGIEVESSLLDSSFRTDFQMNVQPESEATQPANAAEKTNAPAVQPKTEETLLEKSDSSQSDTHPLEGEILETGAASEQPLFRNTDAMPVKVGEASVLDTENPEFSAKLSQTIEQASSQGIQKVQIQLTPENLGKVVVEMTQDSNGLLHIVLHAENERAVRILQDHSAALGELLQQNSSGQVRVEVPSQQTSQESWQPPDQQHSGGQQREQKPPRQDTEDFLNQLRLGLLQTDVQ